MRLKLAAVIIMYFNINTAVAQKIDTIQVGKPLPRHSLLTAKITKYCIYTKSTTGKLLNFFLLERSVQPVMDSSGWLVVQKYLKNGDPDIDSTIFTSKSYLPVAYHTDVPTEKHKEHVFFDGTSVTAQIIYPDSIVTKDQSTRTLAYSVVMEQELLQALPLHKGYSFVIPGINPGAHYGTGLTYVLYKVVAKERIAGPAATSIECWKIVFGKSTLWISTKTQELIKREYIFPNGNVFVKSQVIV